MKRAVFFDRDGIVNIRIVSDYVKKIEEFIFIEDFFDLFSIVKRLGYLAILVTNQQGIGKGLMTSDDLEKVHNFMNEKLQEKTNYKFDAIYYCPDLAQSGSKRRKPNPGMFIEAIEHLGLMQRIHGQSEIALRTLRLGKQLAQKQYSLGCI
jgi:D-glycero-D-manno-heptose 1,7-bisphosphate phosphatase